MLSTRKVRAVGTTELMALFDCSAGVIHELVARGIIVKLDRGQYDQNASTTNYLKHLRERSHQAGNLTGNEAMLLKRANRELAEARIAQVRGTVIDLEEAKAMVVSHARLWRAAFLGLPARIRQRLKLSIPVEEKIEAVIDERLEELAEETIALGAGGSGDTAASTDAPAPVDRGKRPIERKKLTNHRPHQAVEASEESRRSHW